MGGVNGMVLLAFGIFRFKSTGVDFHFHGLLTFSPYIRLYYGLCFKLPIPVSIRS